MAKKLVKVSSRKAVAKRAPAKVKVVESEEFTTDRSRGVIPAGSVQLMVNGTDCGVKSVGKRNMRAFVTSVATEFGIRNFSVYLDGQKATTKDGDMQLSNVVKVEMVAKDARGSN